MRNKTRAETFPWFKWQLVSLRQSGKQRCPANVYWCWRSFSLLCVQCWLQLFKNSHQEKKNFSLFTSSSILPSSHCSRINQIICLCHFSSHFLSLSHALSRRKITHVRFNELIFSLSLFLSLTHTHTLSHTLSHLTVFECNNPLTLSHSQSFDYYQS